MKALILKKVMLAVEPGSIVEISEGQFKALGDKATTYKVEAKEEENKEVIPKTSKKTSRSRKSKE